MSATFQPTVPFGSTPVPRQEIAASAMITPVVVVLGTPNPINVRVNTKFAILGVTQLNLGTTCYVEGSGAASGDDDWFEMYRWTSQPHTTANLQSEALTNSPAAGATSFTISALGLFVPEDYCFIFNGTNYSAPNCLNSEWVRIKTASGSTITVNNSTGLVYAQNTSSTLYRGAERATRVLDTSNVQRLRFNASNGLQTVGTTIIEMTCTAAGGFG